jgi:NAD(P)-dependent dehydrogenase (short-subunit alcohol dehydrogenase family)
METNIATDIMSRAHPEGIQLAIKTMAVGAPYSPLSEVANVILSLCSDGMHAVNGACVPVDNAWTAF